MRKECVLLRLVEAVNLIDKQDRLPAELEPLFGSRNDFAYSRDAFSDCGKRYELTVGVARDDSSDCRFA